MVNNSSTKVDITIKYKGPGWNNFSEWVEKNTKILVSENLVFVREGKVVEYASISKYLDEFRLHKEGIILRKMKFDLSVLNLDLEFLEAKVKFLKFMVEKKRKDSQVKKWLSKYKITIRKRLEGIKLISLTQEHIKNIEEEIKRIKLEIIKKKKEVQSQNKKYKSISKKVKWEGVPIESQSEELEEELEESIDGIEVWSDYDKEDDEDET